MSDTHGWISKDWCNWYHPGAAKDRQNSKYINHWLTSFLASPYLFEVVIYFQTCWYLLHVGWYLFESVCISDIWTSALKHYQFSWSISFKRYGPAKLILSSSFSRHLLAQGGLDSKPNCYQFWGSITFKISCLLAPEPCLRTSSLYILKDMDQQTDIVWELRFIYLIYTLTKNISANIEKILNSIKRLDPKSCGPRKTDVNRTNGWSLWYLVHIYCNTWIVPTIPVLTEPFVVHSEIVKLYIVSVNDIWTKIVVIFKKP